MQISKHSLRRNICFVCLKNFHLHHGISITGLPNAKNSGRCEGLLSRNECRKVSAARRIWMKKINQKGYPPGCYLHVRRNVLYYNEASSEIICTVERICMCGEGTHYNSKLKVCTKRISLVIILAMLLRLPGSQHRFNTYEKLTN